MNNDGKMYWNNIPVVKSTGEMEVGNRVDFHHYSERGVSGSNEYGHYDYSISLRTQDPVSSYRNPGDLYFPLGAYNHTGDAPGILIYSLGEKYDSSHQSYICKSAGDLHRPIALTKLGLVQPIDNGIEGRL
jgi:hypothetical protein